MQTPLQITLRGIVRSEPIESYVRTRADKLERFSDRITGCHVMIEQPHRHKRHGRHHRVRIDLAVPGNEIVVTRNPDERKDQEDLYASIDAAFDDAQRVLEDHVRTQRGDVKARETPSRHGQVTKLYSYEGYGFLTTPEGEEIYFHQNSVLNHAFERLTIGTRVRFVEEAGEKGPQASTVAIVD
jgi:ribosomal subunit interface protein